MYSSVLEFEVTKKGFTERWSIQELRIPAKLNGVHVSLFHKGQCINRKSDASCRVRKVLWKARNLRLVYSHAENAEMEHDMYSFNSSTLIILATDRLFNWTIKSTNWIYHLFFCRVCFRWNFIFFWTHFMELDSEKKKVISLWWRFYEKRHLNNGQLSA